jgi:branched-chain amino acid transport system ATP-binding protein
MGVCDPIVVMAQGKVICEGDAAGARRDPAGARRVSRGHAGMSAPLLSAKDIVAGYFGGLPVVHGISVDVAPREIVTLIGPNGAGKSTFLKAIAGLIAPESGRVTLGEREITSLPAHSVVAAGIGLRAADRQCLHDADDPREPESRRPYAARRACSAPRARLRALSGPCGKAPAARPRAFRRTAADARHRTRADDRAEGSLLLDEPTAGLAPQVVGEVFPPAAAPSPDSGAWRLLMVEQNAKAALHAVSDRRYVLAEGP